MSGSFRVDTEQLMEAVERLQRFDGQLQAAMDDADREVNRLHATWTGAAADAHRAAHATWRRSVVEMHEALGMMRGAASGAHDNYTAAVEANLTMWRL